jgi:DNA-binding MarR family transcriptional regulator
MSDSAIGDCNGTAIRMAARRITLLYDDALGACGMRSTQYSILAALGEMRDAPPTIGELAERLTMDASALGHTLKPLVREGWIALVGSKEDRRRKRLVLTHGGQAQLLEAEALWRQAQAKFEQVIGVEAAAALRLTLLAMARDERLSTIAA